MRLFVFIYLFWFSKNDSFVVVGGQLDVWNVCLDICEQGPHPAENSDVSLLQTAN